MAIKIGNINVVNNDRSFVTLSGTTRPPSPQIGMIWFNNALGVFEIYDGNSWEELAGTPDPPGTGAWAWGNGGDGRLGTGDENDRSSPVPVIGGISDWVQVSPGSYHSVALRANGTVWSWGRGFDGQLGTGFTGRRSSPVLVVGGFTDWVQVSAGTSQTVALRANGTAWAWGYGASGRLGTGNTISRSSPVSVIGGISNWVQVTSSGSLTIAIRANGTAWSWGFNNNGQLGTNDTLSRSSPTSVVGGISDWVQVTNSGLNTVGLRANGTVWGWGNNNNGRLGTNDTINRSSPTSVVGGISDWVQVTSGGPHTIAIRANGTAWAWGNGSYGRLGTGNTISRSSPVSVIGGISDWVQVSAGFRHIVGLRANGTVWAWGQNQSGQLGTGNTISRSSPVSVIGGISDWVRIDGGEDHTVAIRKP